MARRKGRTNVRRRQHSSYLARVEFPALAVSDFLTRLRVRGSARVDDLLDAMKDRAVKTRGELWMPHPTSGHDLAAHVSQQVLDAIAKVLDHPQVELVDDEFRWRGT